MRFWVMLLTVLWAGPMWADDKLVLPDNDDLAALTEGLIPLVEEAAGVPFLEPPSVIVATRGELVEVLLEEIQPQLTALLPEEQLQEAEPVLRMLLNMVSVAVMGKYATGTDSVLVLPENLAFLVDEGFVEPDQAEGVMTIIVAHELGHALQDQYIDLKASIGEVAGDFNRAPAFNAMIEGHAVLIQERVAEELGLDEEINTVATLLSAGEMGDDMQGAGPLGALGHMVASQYELIYLGGRDFMQYHYEQGGNELLWLILEHPPTSLDQVQHPERYEPPVPVTP